MASHCPCLYWLSSCPLVSYLLTNLPFNNCLLSLTKILDALNSGSTTIIIPPLTVIERQLKMDCLKYGIKVLVGSEVSSEFSKSPQFVTSADGSVVQLSPEEFEEAMKNDRPEVLVCSVEFLATKKVTD